MADQPPDEVLPCGCIFRYAVTDGINTMTVIPCRKRCAVLDAWDGAGTFSALMDARRAIDEAQA